MKLNSAAVLKAGSVVFGISAIALAAIPAVFLQLLDFRRNSELEWAMRIIGITVAALAGNMWNVASHANRAVVRRSARVMQVGSFALGVATVMTPHAFTGFVMAYAMIGFGFSLVYTVTLSQESVVSF